MMPYQGLISPNSRLEGDVIALEQHRPVNTDNEYVQRTQMLLRIYGRKFVLCLEAYAGLEHLKHAFRSFELQRPTFGFNRTKRTLILKRGFC